MIEHLSYSSVSSYLMCAKSWRYKYIDQVPTLASPALVFGTAIHNAVEEYISAGDPQLAIDWGKHWAEAIEEPVEWSAEDPNDYYDMGYRITTDPEIKAEIDKIKPMFLDGQPQVERFIQLYVPNVEIPIIGYIDIIHPDGIPGDFKTSSRSWTQSQAEEETQSLFYLAALHQQGKRVPGWTFRHYIFVKTKKPKFQMFEHTHNPGQVMWLYSMIRNVWRGIKAEVYPENPTTWKCNPKWCEFWSMCRGRY